jgi:type VI protein secretion system component VasK
MNDELLKSKVPLPVGGDETKTTPTPLAASQSEVEVLRWIMIGVIIILLVGFATFIIQQFTASQTAFNNLSNQITTQNAEINNLIIELQAQKGVQPLIQ